VKLSSVGRDLPSGQVEYRAVESAVKKRNFNAAHHRLMRASVDNLEKVFFSPTDSPFFADMSHDWPLESGAR